MNIPKHIKTLLLFFIRLRLSGTLLCPFFKVCAIFFMIVLRLSDFISVDVAACRTQFITLFIGF